MSVDAILEGLNAPQRDAVTSHPERNALVLAGAGSGKTRVLTHRFAWLVATQGVAPREILTVTFTNKAAKEMRERIARLNGQSGGGLWVGTFHAMCRRMLLRFAQEAGLPASFRILDRGDQRSLVREALRRQGQPTKARDVNLAISWISKQKGAGRRARHVHPRNHAEDSLLEVMKLYEKNCQTSGLADFDELLLRCVELLRENDSVRRHYQARFRYLLVDEYQDVNDLQNAWLELIADGERPLFVVGDDDQSIYGWRGARPRHILDFEKSHSNVERWTLEQNYRSTQPILECANALIANNHERHPKRLWTERTESEPVTLFGAPDDLAESRHAVTMIEEWVAAGGKWSDCAVLYRMNRRSQRFEAILGGRGIPYRVYGGLRFYERQEVKDTLAYFQLCLNPHDDAAWDRVCNVPRRGIGDGAIEAARQRAREAGESLFAAAAHVERQPGNRAGKALGVFRECIESLQEETNGLGLAERLRRILKDSGLLEMYQARDREEEETRSENLSELVNQAATFEDGFEPEEGDIQDPVEAFLASTALEAGERGEGADGDAVQLMTLHMAKGLEFPLVTIAGLEEGSLPMTRDDSDPEEERRLFYVGVTRAQQKLLLTYSDVRMEYGRPEINHPSSFLPELAGDLVQSEAPAAAAATRASPAKAAVTDGLDVPQPGESVRHPRFGLGVIVEYEGRPPQLRVQVRFEEAGPKWLMYDYAKLESV